MGILCFVAIQSFSDADAKAFFISGLLGKQVGWANMSRIVRRKLDMIHYAARLFDLKAPPGNRLESLSRDLEGYYSIRVNDQWRIVFRWADAGPSEVRVTDYH
jgi:proteic killer suppression protein